MPKLRSVARAIWYGYSLLCVLFLGVIVADLLLIWRVGFQAGVLIYVNKLGEGYIEQIQIMSVVPWIAVTAVKTVQDAISLEKPKTRLTREEWAAFREWHARNHNPTGQRESERKAIARKVGKLSKEKDSQEVTD